MSGRLPTTTCPHCLRHYDGAAAVTGDDHPPRDGDAALCIDCCELSVYDSAAPGGRRLPTPAEQVLFDGDDAVRLSQVLLRRFREDAR